jgi:phosphatidylglycerophosphatase A
MSFSLFIDRLCLFVCRLGIAGLSPRAPGTCGSFVAVLLAPVCFLPLPPAARVGALALIFVLGALAATRVERMLATKDPGQIVIDELLGMWLTLLPHAQPSWRTLLAAFVLFRLFDIIKLWPAKSSEDWLPGGWGVMIDDVVAGVQAMVVLHLLGLFGWFG